MKIYDWLLNKPVVRSEATWYPDRRVAIGDTILALTADGCMAHDHKFAWAGQVESFSRIAIYNGNVDKDNNITNFEMVATVKLLKEGSTDCRDWNDPLYREVCLQDRCLQWLAPNFWIFIR